MGLTPELQAHPRASPPTQVFQDYGFHPLVQRWIIGQCLCVDERTVSSYGIRRDGDTAFLYLLSAKMAELTEQRYEEDQARVMLSSTSSLSDAAGEGRKYNTLPNMSPRRGLAPLRAPHRRGGRPGSCLAPAQGAGVVGTGTLASGCCCAGGGCEDGG